MTPEDKELLLKDLCARLPYRVHVETMWKGEDITRSHQINTNVIDALLCNEIESVKPYLRPTSSMTEEEKKELSIILNYEFYADDDFALVAEDDRHRIRLELCGGYIDWLNIKMFDYRGLIEKGLALEAPPEMYNKEESEKGSGIPIPKTPDEAVKTLVKIVSKEDRDYILENGAISVHNSMGRWIRNEWGLWTDSELKNELKKKGFEHPDDMSNYIIEEFIKYWNNRI